MLKLHSLHLSGFKSFVEPTSLRFGNSLTAVVGPNGCGKSNLADAVIWGLGERSAKSLRGDTMEDVIFGGSEGRKALGMAEVTLELRTDPGFSGAEDGRLTITRRVFRSGESDYFLNGRRARLRDLRTLLMDTGLGLRGYSMIEQGQIGMILSGKPQERRRLLEEAAGITHYKDRRRIAEVKLEEARGNLARLDDILGEVERAARSLKRQASAALRYREAQTERARIVDLVLRGRWASLASVLAEVTAGLTGELARDAELSAALARDEAALAAARAQGDREAQELADAHRAEAQVAAAIEGRQEFLKGARQRLQELDERLAGGRQVATERRARQRELGGEMQELERRATELTSERDGAASEVDADSARIDQARRWTEESTGRVESLRGDLLASLNVLTALRNRQHVEHLEREKGELRARHLEGERQTAQELLAETTQAWTEATAEAERVAAIAAAGGVALAEHQRTLAELEARHAELAELRLRLASEQAALGQREALLREMSAARYERLQDLERVLEEAGVTPSSFLSSHLQAPEGWAASLDLYLGELADAAVLRAEENGVSLAVRLTARPTRAVLLRPFEASASASPVADPAVLSSLGEALSLPGPLAAALPPAYLVRSAVDAERLAQRLPGVAFLTREGLWAQGGAIHVQGAVQQPGLLVARAELAQLTDDQPRLRTELHHHQEETAAIETRRDGLGVELAALQADTARAQQALAVAEARREDLTARERRLSLELQTFDTERGELERELAAIVERQSRLTAELGQAEGRHQAIESAFDAAQADLDRSRSEREHTSTSGASRRGLLDVLQQRLISVGAEAQRLRAEREAGDRQLATWAAQETELAPRRSELEVAIAAADTQMLADLEAVAGHGQHLAKLQEALESHRLALAELESRIGVLRQERDATHERQSLRREERARYRQDLEHLAAEFRREIQTEPPSEAGPIPPNLAELEADLDRCQRTLERLGPVNLLAADEHAEQEQRLEFLSAQRRDIASSIDSLKATIRQLDEESSQRFLATFAEVNEGFGKTFTDLFRGGSAEMRLMDENDALEGGLEIVARPPGKRLQNLSLLSGGEKALTAIALLFALFRAKPSPFCILDEVDAPLDDINTLRFVELLKRMASETQFVVITHNKLTMESASTLYGVTMQERGVSQLVAVELDSIQGVAESEPVAASLTA